MCYAYVERHVHGPQGGVAVIPRSRVRVCEGARYQTDFELIRGRVGRIDIDVEVSGEARSVSEVTARIAGAGDDRITIRETVDPVGRAARGVLTSNIALRDTAQAEVLNTLTADAPHARGTWTARKSSRTRRWPRRCRSSKYVIRRPTSRTKRPSVV